jgi:hypothetical protein
MATQPSTSTFPEHKHACAWWAVIGLAAVGLGCGSSGPEAAPEFPADAYTTLASAAGKLTLELRTAPDQPPTVGLSSVELDVADAHTLAPVDGLSIAVVPWMAAMSHGSSAVPAVAAEGGGRYLITNVSFYMPGDWELRFAFSGAAVDTATATLEVR